MNQVLNFLSQFNGNKEIDMLFNSFLCIKVIFKEMGKKFVNHDSNTTSRTGRFSISTSNI